MNETYLRILQSFDRVPNSSLGTCQRFCKKLRIPVNKLQLYMDELVEREMLLKQAVINMYHETKYRVNPAIVPHLTRLKPLTAYEKVQLAKVEENEMLCAFYQEQCILFLKQRSNHSASVFELLSILKLTVYADLTCILAHLSKKQLVRSYCNQLMWELNTCELRQHEHSLPRCKF